MRSTFFCLLTFLFLCNGYAQPTFTVVPLGVHGGSTEDNLSSYLVALRGTGDFIALDAGTVHAGIVAAMRNGSLSGDADKFMRDSIKGYLISHPHLDHLAGLIINSPDDAEKPVYGTAFCLSVIEDKYFTWKSWANFGDQGEKPQLGKYHYVTLRPDSPVALSGTKMRVSAFLLSHGNPYQSTAFLVGTDSASVLYLGDTGCDSLEKSTRLHDLWQSVAPLVVSGRLKGIFIEVSFPDSQPPNKLFGHLTPRLLMKEMTVLAGLSGETTLRKVPVLITHIKPGNDRGKEIPRELQAENHLGLRLIFPVQGRALAL